MKRLLLLTTSILLSSNTVYGQISQSPYDIIRTELIKINSADADYIQSNEPFAPFVNAFIANAKDDKEAEKKYLTQLQQNLPPFFEQKIAKAYSEWDQKDLRTAQEKISEAIKSENLYNVLKALTEFQDKIEYCYRRERCKPLFLSRFSFLKLKEQIAPKKAYGSCQDVTTFYPICKNEKNEDYNKDEDPQKLKLALSYAQEPLKYYRQIRIERPKEQDNPEVKNNKEAPSAPTGDWTWEEAVTFMETNPQKAYNTFKKAKTLTEKLQLAIFLQAYFPEKIKEIKDNLREVVQKFDNGDKYIEYSRKYNKEEFQQKFASELSENDQPISMEYLIEVVTTASDKSLLDTQFLDIYCGVAKKMPEILEATKPYYGGNRDNFIPRLACYYDNDYQNFPSRAINRYTAKTQKADGNFLSDNEGTIRFYYGAMQNYKMAKAFLGMEPQETEEYNLKYPYEAWSYQSLEARKAFEEIKQSYLETQKVLMDYYTQTRKFSQEKAQRITEDILFNYPFGTRNSYDKIPLSLRKMMIEQEDLEKIKSFASEKDFMEKQKNTIKQEYNAPLIHIAVQNPEYLKLLLKITSNMNKEKQKQYDMEADINARNDIGKTPLMVAAQFNLLESAKILMDNNADINASTQTEEYIGLLRDNRTALMYAAENADLEFIKLLLENGADKNATDTQGYRAVDYLMGFASGNYNHKLTEEDFKQALTLLL